MHSAQGIGARVGARVRRLVQGLGGARVRWLVQGFGARVGARVWCWCKGLVQELVQGFGVGVRV
jgi:hypothetical protein